MARTIHPAPEKDPRSPRKKKNDPPVPAGTVEARPITEELRESYLDYAMSVIVSRALPDLRDGMKPVQRRILWAMWDLGLSASSKFMKSARVTGETMGKYHPHGDMAVYDALVRMAQDFSLRYPLVQGQGNFGCFTKDTRVKLTDRRNVSFGELVEERRQGRRNYTYTVNSAGLISIAEIKNPRRTRINAELVRVVLDNGESIRCTPDHRFMLKDGSYKEARDLQSGERLMPLYQKLSTASDRLNREGYVLVYQPKTDTWIPAHHLADNCNLSAGTYQKNAGRVRHHAEIYRYGASTKWETGVKKYFDGNPDLVLQELGKNHKVVFVEALTQREDVYDLTIERHHNFALAAGIFVHNSMDGDPAAAQRYTEARLSKIAEEMLSDIEKETVAWRDNYDNSRLEPSYLPAKLPNLIVNGTVGIAVGMATSIPPHNLGEVADAIIYLAKHTDATVGDLMKFIPGPDFPTGGIIYDRSAILSAYQTGRGSITMRGVAEIEEGKRSAFHIIITEIPYQVNKSDLVTKMAELVTEKRIEGVKDIRDESDREGLRIVLDLKADAAPQKILNQLFEFTELQKNFYFNMLALVDGIQPQILSLKEVLAAYLTHREDVIRRRTAFDLARAEERAHILEGLVKALDSIDKVIETIKKSEDRDDARKNLTKKFGFTEVQASAILEMRLHTLAALERGKLEEELKEKKKLMGELKLILKTPAKIAELIVQELEELKRQFPDARRTKVVSSGLKEFKDEDLIAKEDIVLVLTEDGYLKRLPPAAFRAQRRGGKGLIGFDLKDTDQIREIATATTHDNVLFFTDKGRAFQTKAYEIPVSSRTAKGKSILNFLSIPQGEKVTALVAYGDEEAKDAFLMMATRKGIVKKTPLGDFRNVRRSGIIALKLKGDDALRWATLSSGSDEVILVTALGQSIRFKEKDVRAMGRSAGGVGAVRLKKGDEVAGLDIIRANGEGRTAKLLVVMSKGYAKQTPLKEYKTQRRGGGGIKTAHVTEKTGRVMAATIVTGEEEEALAFSSKGQALRTKLADIRVAGRATQGVRIINLESGDTLIGLVCL